MTSVTHSQFGNSHGATKGARRATGVASCELAGWSSPRAILILSDRCSIDANDHLLCFNVYGCNSVFIRSLRGHFESLAKDVQHQITPDKPDQVIFPCGRLSQRVFGSLDQFRKPYAVPTLIKRSQRRLTSELGVPVTSIMFLLEYQRLRSQFFFSLHVHPAKKTPSVVIIELFNDTISPRLSHRNKPGFDTVEQTQPDQIPHPSRKLPAAEENRLIVH